METNPYPDNYEQASSHLRLALSLLAKHRIPPSPLNFRTAYEYELGSNKALKKAFEKVLNGEQESSNENLWEIYRQFFFQDDAAIEQMRQELRRIITAIQGEVESSGGKVSEYADTLNGFVEILDSSPPADVMHSEVRKVIDGTRTMERSQRKLESKMSSVLEEVEVLRKELEQVREESLTDALTGLSNRKAFDKALAGVFQESAEPGSVFCLLLADIDHFKQFNDTFGHIVGDKVLRFVGSTLKSCVKGKDTAARYGGEEFAVILPKTDSIGSCALAEQIRKEISSGKLKNRESGESYGRLTISIGVSQFRPGDSPADLIRRADEALYMAKENGRNRVERQL